MKKLATALSIGAFSLVFSQGVNISKFHRAYIAQDENNPCDNIDHNFVI